MHCSELAMPFRQMESWSCVAGGKGLVPHDMMSPSSIGGGRSKNAAISWDLSAATSGFDRDMMVSSHNVHASNGVGGMGFQELSTRQFSDNSCGNVMIDGHFAGVNGSSSNFAHPMLSADCHDSLLVDLRLGRFLPDIMEGHNSRVPQVIPSFSSPGSSMPQKRIRSGGICSQVAYCQVYGCNKNLSSCKDYHKRHKVCEVHSKTPNVIVNGIEQRFCQQCSRFHLLAEFDDSKRSCRKRLSGHNARRRKPQVSVQAGRIGRLLQPYIGPGGNLFHTNSSRASSLIYPDIIFSGSLLNSDQGVGTSNLSGCIKVEDGNIFGSLPSVPHSKGYLDSKSPYSSYERPFNFFHDGVTSAPSVIFANNNQCQRDLGRRYSTCHYSFQEEASIGTEDYTIFDTASTVQVLSGISKSGCARSLLSSQSRSSSSHSSGIPMAQQPLIATGTDYQSTLHAYNRGLSDKASS